MTQLTFGQMHNRILSLYRIWIDEKEKDASVRARKGEHCRKTEMWLKEPTDAGKVLIGKHKAFLGYVVIHSKF